MPVIIFKAVEQCNSNCAYCNVIKKKIDETMTLELLKIVFKRIDTYLRTFTSETIAFTWHGGEVCLLGADYFREVLGIIEENCPATKERIEHLIQSNLTLVNQELLDVFKKLGVTQIGSSYEPLPNIRGFGSQRDSGAYNTLFFDGIELLKKNDIGWGVIYVVHKKSLPHAQNIFNFLTNLSFSSSPNFNPVLLPSSETDSDLALSPEDYGHFLGSIFPFWWANRKRFPNVKPFEDYQRAICDNDVRLRCGLSGKCAHNWVNIGPSGDTSHCGVAGDFSFISYGNIRDRELEEIFGDRKRDVFLRRVAWLAGGPCGDCRFWGICHGGCPMEAVSASGDIMQPSPFCASTKVFLENYFEPVTGCRAEFYPSPSDLSLIEEC